MLTPRHSRFLSDINIIPLVDVVLVLLVIFMVTAPMLHRGIDLTLPTSTANTIKPEERLIITIEADQTMFFGKDPVNMLDLQTRLKNAKQRNPDVAVYLRSDQTIPYGQVVRVMDTVKSAGIERLGMVTDPGKTRIDEERLAVQ
ncbi:MAG: protein TolR [Nitrospirales bacterium]|nr:protein TolR [Nitrospirales bacterium]